jgi:hypothetical protein
MKLTTIKCFVSTLEQDREHFTLDNGKAGLRIKLEIPEFRDAMGDVISQAETFPAVIWSAEKIDKYLKEMDLTAIKGNAKISVECYLNSKLNTANERDFYNLNLTLAKWTFLQK